MVPLVLAFYYTWLYNKTKSVLLCILLHASFTPAQDHLLLTADSPLVDAVLLATYLVGAGVLIALTRGRLGYGATKSDADSDQRSSVRWLSAGQAVSLARLRLPPVPWPIGRLPSSVPIDEPRELLPVS